MLYECWIEKTGVELIDINKPSWRYNVGIEMKIYMTSDHQPAVGMNINIPIVDGHCICYRITAWKPLPNGIKKT